MNQIKIEMEGWEENKTPVVQFNFSTTEQFPKNTFLQRSLKGLIRDPSRMQNQPLKSMVQTSLGR
jgi:hypothetical protein